MRVSRRSFFTLLRVATGVCILVYLGLRGAIDWPALFGLAMAWKLTLLALLLLFLDVVVTAWRMCVLFKPRGFHLSLGSSVRLALIGNFFNSFLLGSIGGDVVKIFYATQGNRGRRTEVAMIVLLDRAAGMFALLIWPLGAILFFPGLLRTMPVLRDLLLLAALVALGMVGGTLFCFSRRVQTSTLLSTRLPRVPGGALLGRALETVSQYRDHWQTLLASIAISLLAHTLTIGVTVLTARATNPQLTGWEMSVLIPLGFLVNTLPVTPGGLGVGEAAFDALFSRAGLSGGAEALLGWRLLMVVIGLLGLVFYLRGGRRYIYSSEALPLVVTQD